VYRVAEDGTYAPFATDLGVACGLCFDADGHLFVGDRSGTIFRIDANGHADTFASLPPSVAAFHLAIGPDRDLYVTAPTLSCSDPVYRIDQDGRVTVYSQGFGRPQGLAFDGAGALHVVEALAGSSGVYRLESGRPSEIIVAGPGLVGVAFDPTGGLVVCTNDTVYRLMA
jgi:sugar lactone lactonase YvrE